MGRTAACTSDGQSDVGSVGWGPLRMALAAAARGWTLEVQPCLRWKPSWGPLPCTSSFRPDPRASMTSYSRDQAWRHGQVVVQGRHASMVGLWCERT